VSITTPPKRAWSDPEGRLKIRIARYLRAFFPPPGTWKANEAGLKFGGSDVQRAAQWGRLKARGVKVGIEDFDANYMGNFIALEAKAGKNGLRVMQKKREVEVVANGGKYFVIRSIAVLHHLLISSGIPIVNPSFALATAEGYDRELAAPVAKKAGTSSAYVKVRLSKKAQAFGRAVMAP
jgi:hypothetical protein